MSSTHHTFIEADSLEWMKQQPNDIVDLVFGSPPYHGKATRYIGGKNKKMSLYEWVDWMTEYVREATRISRGYVFVVANGCVQNGAYQPSTELLVASCFRLGIALDRTVIWHKNAPPNRKDYFGNDWEPILAFRHPAIKNKTWNWEAIGHTPAYTSGGDFRQRGSNGERRKGNSYPTGKLARPRDVLRVTVGGGHLGWKRAHENEAPFPEKLVEPFVLAFTNHGDTILDPWSGSGTVGAVAYMLGRNSIGVDNRASQVQLGYDRIRELKAA